MNHLLRLGDLSAVELERVLAIAADPRGYHDSFDGWSLACFLDDPATRHHLAVATAARRLGLLPVMLTPREVETLRGDPTGDLPRSLASYTAGLVVATLSQRALRDLARVSAVPVVNAASDEEDPIQALADLLTLKGRFGALAGLTVAYVGAGDQPITHSLMEAAARTGMHLRVACPPEHAPILEIAAATAALAGAHGGSVTVGHDPARAVVGARVVYATAWPEPLDRAFRVSSAMLGDAVFMHPLPARRGQEVTIAVIDGSRSLVREQAANYVPATQAALATVLA